MKEIEKSGTVNSFTTQFRDAFANQKLSSHSQYFIEDESAWSGERPAKWELLVQNSSYACVKIEKDDVNDTFWKEDEEFQYWVIGADVFRENGIVGITHKIKEDEIRTDADVLDLLQLDAWGSVVNGKSLSSGDRRRLQGNIRVNKGSEKIAEYLDELNESLQESEAETQEVSRDWLEEKRGPAMVKVGSVVLSIPDVYRIQGVDELPSNQVDGGAVFLPGEREAMILSEYSTDRELTLGRGYYWFDRIPSGPFKG